MHLIAAVSISLISALLRQQSLFAGEAVTEAVAAPVNEDLNEEDEAPEENALAETAATEKKAAKGAAKQQKVTWLGSSQAGACGEQLYRYRHTELTVMACMNKAPQVISRQKQPISFLVSISAFCMSKGLSSDTAW